VTRAAVEFERLTVERGGRPVLHELDGSFAAGRVTGLFGPSGSGKSTLIRAIAGVQSGVRGTLAVLGRQPGSVAVRRELGYMTQNRWRKTSSQCLISASEYSLRRWSGIRSGQLPCSRSCQAW
jgi:ABC-type Mn2+/Zn2+ transport system ATPase subunit